MSGEGVTSSLIPKPSKRPAEDEPDDPNRYNVVPSDQEQAAPPQAAHEGESQAVVLVDSHGAGSDQEVRHQETLAKRRRLMAAATATNRYNTRA